MKKFALLLVCFVSAACTVEAMDSTDQTTQASGPFGPPLPAPADYDEFGVFTVNGGWVFASPVPGVPNCENSTICITDKHYTDVMNLTPAEVLTERDKAKEWFVNRFGMDVDDPANAGRLSLFPFTVNPNLDFRAYYISGRHVPSDGYEVRDGGFALAVTDPNGFTMGGDFPGRHIPQNSLVAFGVYNVLITDPAGNPADEKIYYYRADTANAPVSLTGADGGIFAASCQLSTTPFQLGGQTGADHNGFIRLFQEVELFDNGVFDTTTRHVITVGGRGPRLY